MLADLAVQHALVPYKTMLIGVTPGAGFMFWVVSLWREESALAWGAPRSQYLRLRHEEGKIRFCIKTSKQ